MIRWQGWSRLNAGAGPANPAPSATLTVYATRTNNLASLYAANDTGQTKANPFTAGTDGYGFFYAANGRYDLVVSGGGIVTPYTLADLVLYDSGTVGS
jgi:hypothetical protein